MILRFGDFELDTARYTLHRGGHPVDTQPRVLDLLVHLASAGDRVVSRDELRRTVWKGLAVSETALRFAVKEARRALADDGSRQRWIRTVRGRGFRFVGPTTSYAFMQAMGLVNDHVEGCATRPRAEAARRRFRAPRVTRAR